VIVYSQKKVEVECCDKKLLFPGVRAQIPYFKDISIDCHPMEAIEFIPTAAILMSSI